MVVITNITLLNENLFRLKGSYSSALMGKVTSLHQMWLLESLVYMLRSLLN